MPGRIEEDSKTDEKPLEALNLPLQTDHLKLGPTGRVNPFQDVKNNYLVVIRPLPGL
jgi:hypothetical protein